MKTVVRLCLCVMLMGLLAACTEQPSPNFTTPLVLQPQKIDPSFVATAAAVNRLPGVNFDLFTAQFTNMGDYKISTYAMNDSVGYAFSTQEATEPIYLDSCNKADILHFDSQKRAFVRVATENDCPGLGQPQYIAPKSPFQSGFLPYKRGLQAGYYQLQLDFYTRCPRGALSVANCGNGIPSSITSLLFLVTSEYRPTPVPTSPVATPAPGTPTPHP